MAKRNFLRTASEGGTPIVRALRAELIANEMDSKAVKANVETAVTELTDNEIARLIYINEPEQYGMGLFDGALLAGYTKQQALRAVVLYALRQLDAPHL